MREEQRKRLMQILYLNRISFLYPIEKICILSHYMDRTYTKKSDAFFNKMLGFTVDDWKSFLGRSLSRVDFKRYMYQVIRNELLYDMYWLDAGRGKVCTIEDDAYPYLLKQIDDPPVVLYIRGNVDAINRSSVSIVGTRNPNEEGTKAASDLGMQFVNMGHNVVSGFALGIDICAHMGVIEAYNQEELLERGKPVVVLGTCVDYIYPVRHKQYAQKILNIGGVFISELPLQRTYGKYSFIARNRIISALAMHTVVVQAPKKSGALATANFALEQGRSVWVDKSGLISQYEGTMNLWMQGAQEVAHLNMRCNKT